MIELSDGLVSYWPLDGNAEDSAAQANGVIVGEPRFVNAEHGSGILLNGVDQYIEVPDDGDRLGFPGTQDFTVSAWIRGVDLLPEPIRNWPNIVSSHTRNSSWSLDMQRDWDLGATIIEYGGLGLTPTNGTFPTPLRTQRIDDGQMHHIVGVSEGRELGSEFVRLYLDGVLIEPPKPNGDAISRANRGASDNDFPFTIGKDARDVENTGGSSWSGVIDDVAIWNRALNGFEIVEIYESNRSVGALIAPTDSDGDGLEDSWEERFGLELGSNDGPDDPDADGLSNLVEFERRSDPTNSDSDADGLADDVETGTGIWQSAQDTGTFPNRPDSDDDGLVDGAEVPDLTVVGVNEASDPNRPDSDGDGVGDLAEAIALSGPANPDSKPGDHWNVRAVETDDSVLTLEEALALLSSDDEGLDRSNWNEPVIDWVTESFSSEVLRDSTEQGVLEGDDVYFPHVRVPSPKQSFVLEAEGTIFTRLSGVYTFSLRTADGMLSIDDVEIGRVERRGLTKTSIFPVSLEAGFHQVKVVSYGLNSLAILEVGITGVPGVDQINDAKFELLTASNPNQGKAPAFRVLWFDASPSGRTVRWESTPGRRYQVEHSPSLEPGSFIVVTELEATESVTSFTDDDIIRLGRQGYYRVALLDQ